MSPTRWGQAMGEKVNNSLTVDSVGGAVPVALGQGKIEFLESALADFHALAVGALERIGSLARCVLCAPQAERAQEDIQSIKGVLQAIAQDAQSIEKHIDAEANRQGMATF